MHSASKIGRPPSAAAPGTGPVALLLFVSGAVALVYEVLWQRQFALVFGSAAPATAAVLAAYFAGLGAGALAIGRRARRWIRPLRAYALLELTVGTGALLVSPLLAGFERTYPALYPALAGHAGWFTAVRTAVAFAVLLIPAGGMGGTLPLLGAWIDRDRRQLGRTAGGLYVVNTAGAALGALAFPWLLLPRLGLARTTLFCAATNFALALGAALLDRRTGPVPSAPVAREPGRPAGPAADSAAAAGPPVLIPAVISGFATFALQVLWNRALAQVHENSMQAFALVVAVVIAALAIGAQLARLGLRRGLEPHHLAGGAWMLAGLAAMGGPWLCWRLSDGLAYLPAGAGSAGPLAGLACALILPPMALLGIGLPAIMELAGRRPGHGAADALGRVLAANIAGAVAGALAAGYVLPLWPGLWPALTGLGALLLAAGVWQATWRAAAPRPGRRAAVFAAGWALSLWPLSRTGLPRVHLDAGSGERLLALAEGAHGITAVVESRGSRRLKLNNHYGLGGTFSTGDERMQAHVPLLLHGAPRRVAFLGLGTGITAGGALFHPVDRVTVAELVPEVVAASHGCFRASARGVLDDPRTRIVRDDARNFLRGTADRFDVIVGDLVVPWRQGEGSLFTLEQFAAARRALAPDGVFCQWLPLFQLSGTQVTILARTFLTVFPHAQLWRGDFSPTAPALALIGTAGAASPDPALVRRRLVGTTPDPANPQLRSVAVFWMNFIGVLEASDLSADETRLNREDRPWVELLGPPASPGDGHAAAFTGRPLQAWTSRVQRHLVERLAPLPPREAVGVAAGGVLAEMTLCLAEDDRAGAQAAQERLRAMLPDEDYRLLFP